MKKKTISELTIEELREIVKEGHRLRKEGCNGVSCFGCVIDNDTYTDAPADTCRNVHNYLISELAKREAEREPEEPVPEEFEYTDDYVFTPENTSLEYLIENNLLQKLDDYIGKGNENGGRDRRNSICSHSSCSDCRLSSDKFSKTLIVSGGSGCSDVGDGITALRRAYDKINEHIILPPKQIQKTCADCKYRTEVGGYIYCNAWKNFTTDTMTCGYYLTKGAESDILDTP